MSTDESKIYNAINELVFDHCLADEFHDRYDMSIADDAINYFKLIMPTHWFKAPFNDEHIEQYVRIFKHHAWEEGAVLNDEKFKDRVLIWRMTPVLMKIDKFGNDDILHISSRCSLIHKKYLSKHK